MNTHNLIGLIGALLLLVCSGCADDPAVWGDAKWQVRCPDGLVGCSRAGEAVDVFNFNGVDGVFADCQVVSASADERVISLSVGRGGQRLSIDGLLTGGGGGAVRGATCRVTILDDANTYGGSMFGTCGGGVPGMNQPCQINNLNIDPNGTDGPTVEMDVLCRSIAAATNPTILQRDLVDPMALGAAHIRMLNCPGIE